MRAIWGALKTLVPWLHPANQLIRISGDGAWTPQVILLPGVELQRLKVSLHIPQGRRQGSVKADLRTRFNRDG